MSSSLKRPKNCIEVFRATACPLSSFSSPWSMWLLKRMSVQSFPSPRQNTRGVKWLIMDQDLTGPTTASSSGKEWGHAELLTILPWEDSYWRSQVNQLGNRPKPGTLGMRLQRLGRWKDKIYGFSSLVCLLSKTAFRAHPEMKAVLVFSPTPTPWNEGAVA